MLQSEDTTSFLRHIPVPVLIVALIAALIHIAPYWRAQSQVPDGWTFTGNIHASPDFMQYRVWARQTQHTGPLVDNKFTSESNKPHLPVLIYFAIGKISQWTQWQPEFVFAYLGCVLAFLFTMLLYATVRYFMKSPYQTWWVFMIILVGGGLGAHLKILHQFDIVKENFILGRTIAAVVEGFQDWLLFEDYRSHYIFITLFDTHFLVILLTTLAAIMTLYFNLEKFSLRRSVLMVCMFAVATVLHVYEGITLLAIAGAVTILCWRKGIAVRSAFISLFVCTISVISCMAVQFLLQKSSGLPVTEWRAINVLFSILLIAYPVAWLLILWGLGDYWRTASLRECFILGWVLGCTALTLSGPFYPYPDRGTMTMQISVYIMAGAIFFSQYRRVTWIPMIIIILLLGATPVWMLAKQWVYTGFHPDTAYMFMSAEHREISDLLKRRATKDDLLIVDKSDVDWNADDLWLAPEYPGKFYAGHFFLTVDYQRKQDEIVSFFESMDLQKQADFLKRKGIRFIYVDKGREPERFERVPGLVILKEASIGSLFEYVPAQNNVSS